MLILGTVQNKEVSKITDYKKSISFDYPIYLNKISFSDCFSFVNNIIIKEKLENEINQDNILQVIREHNNDLRKIFNDYDKFYEIMVRADEKTGAQMITRDLVNTPPNIANSSYIVDEVKKRFGNSNIGVNIYHEAKLKSLNMNGHLAVNRASKNKAYTIKLTYTPSKIFTNFFDLF